MRGLVLALSLLSVVVPAVMIYGWVVVGAEVVTGFSDSVSYLMLSDFYRWAFYGVETPHALSHYQGTRFPPLFSMMLGLIGAGTDNQFPAYVFSAATVIVAAVAVWVWVLKDTGRPILAAAISLMLSINPGYFLLCIYPVSEPLALGLVCFALAILAGPRPSASALLTAALIIGIAPLARMAMVSMVCAFVIWLLVGQRRRLCELALPILVSVAPTAAWMLYRATLPGTESYLDSLSDSGLQATTAGWWAMVVHQPVVAFGGLVESFGVARSGWVDYGVAFMLVIGGIGGVSRLKRNRLDVWYVGAYLGMLLIWPYPEEMARFLVLIFPMICLYVVEGGSATVRWILKQDADSLAGSRVTSIVTATVFALYVVAIAPSVSLIAHRALLEVEQELVGDKRNRPFFEVQSDDLAIFYLETLVRTRHLAATLSDIVPRDDCVYAIRPSVIRSVSDVVALPYPYPIGEGRSPQQAFSECNYHFVTLTTTRQLRQPPLYPLSHIEPFTEPLQATFIERGDQSILVAAVLRNAKSTPEPSN